MQLPEPDRTNLPDQFPSLVKEDRQSAMFRVLEGIQPATRVASAQDFLNQALEITEDGGLEPFIGVIHEALVATANTSAFEQIALLAELVLTGMRSINHRAHVVTAFKGLAEGDILPVTRLLPQVARPAKKPSGRNTAAHAIQEATIRAEVNATLTDSRSVQRPSGNLDRDALAEMLAKARDLKEERGNGAAVDERLAGIGAKPLEEQEELKKPLLLTREFIDRMKLTNKIRMGKEEIVATLERSRELQELFTGNPGLVKEPLLRKRLVNLSNELIHAVTKLLDKASASGAVYLTNTSKHLIGQMRAVVENICIRSPDDIVVIERFRFQAGSAHELDLAVLKNIAALLSKRKVGNPHGLTVANALVGNMLEVPEEKKNGEGYAEWTESMTVSIAGEILGKEIDLSSDGFKKLIAQAQQSEGNLQPPDGEKIQAIQSSLGKVELLHVKDIDPSRVEKKSPKQLEKARAYARCLLARLLLTPPNMRPASSTFEKKFSSKFLPHIAASYKGAELVDDGEQKESAAAFLNKAGDGLNFEAGIHEDASSVTEDEADKLRTALKENNSAGIISALDDLFG